MIRVRRGEATTDFGRAAHSFRFAPGPPDGPVEASSSAAE